MHTEEVESQTLDACVSSRSERRRRLWYSLYVLDRLLALQLGRPPAIHDDDCYLALPSRADDSTIDWTMDRLPEILSDAPSMGDYFIHVIGFSKIVGLVLKDLYGTKKSKQEELVSTKQLDGRLTQWKEGLPRVLRFDIGHAFENSLLLKRQVSYYWHVVAAFAHYGSEICLQSSTITFERLSTVRSYASIC